MAFVRRTWNLLPLAVLWLWLCMMAATAALAQNAAIRVKEPTQGEWALLPEWCIDSQDGPYGGPEGAAALNRSPRAAHWVTLMGQDFWHMHHYCRGLRDMLRLRMAGLSTADQVFLRGRAIAEFNYVLSNCKPTMPLLPEVLLKMGEVFVMQGDLASAQTAFERSRTLKPDYWPAYDRWVAVLMNLKQYDRARELTQTALEHAPGEPSLVARLASIDAARKQAPRHARAASAAAR